MEVLAIKREFTGTGSSRSLRKSGKTPGIIYGCGQMPLNIAMDHNDLFHALKKEDFHSSILTLDISGAKYKVLLRDFQMHPYKQRVMHIDFQHIDLTKTINVKVPLHLIGSEISKAIKAGGTVTRVLNEIEILCLPEYLPKFIEIDITHLDIGQSLHANDIVLPQHTNLIPHLIAENPVVLAVKHPTLNKETTEAASAETPAPAKTPAAAAKKP